MTDWQTSGRYPEGQCTDYADSVVLGLPKFWANACDWVNAAHAMKWPTSAKPVGGSVVVYDRGHGYNPDYGHVAVVDLFYTEGERFAVKEGNYRALGKITSRTSTMDGVLGFVLAAWHPPAVELAGKSTRADPTGRDEPVNVEMKRGIIRLAYAAALGRSPESWDALNAWAGRLADDGSNVDAVVTGITDSPEAQDRANRLAELFKHV